MNNGFMFSESFMSLFANSASMSPRDFWMQFQFTMDFTKVIIDTIIPYYIQTISNAIFFMKQIIMFSNHVT